MRHLTPGRTLALALTLVVGAGACAGLLQGPRNDGVSDPPPVLGFEQVVFDNALIAYQRAVGDVDLDGDPDIVATPNETVGELRLYLAPDFQRQIIVNLVPATHGYPYFRGDDLKLADIDRDGDLDVVARIGDSGDQNGKMVWIENPLSACHQLSGSWTVHDLGACIYIKDMVVVDIDRDGRLDVATRGETETFLWFNNGSGAWLKRTLTHPSREGMDAGDLDGDGDVDFALNGFWLETPADPRQQDFAEHAIAPQWYNQNVGWQGNSCKVVVADVDGNGRNDVVLSHSEYTGYPVAWYSASDPRNGPWTEHVIVPVCDACHNLQVADFNGDGKQDVLYGGMITSEERGLTLMLGNAGGGWTPFVIQDQGSYSAEIGDIDRDGDWDIISIRNWDSQPSEIWRNTLRQPAAFGVDQWTRVAVDTTRVRWQNPFAFFGLGWGDINGDGYVDLVSGRYFYRNPGGSMTQSPWPRVDFNASANVDASLVVDVDGDAFGDVIASTGPQIYWLEANDVAGNSWTARLIDGAAPYDPAYPIPQGYALGDIVPGGRPEVLFDNGGQVFAYEIPATNPAAGNWPRTTLVDQTNGEDVAVGDIDRDGFVDIAVAHYTGSGGFSMKWAHNPGNGSGNWPEYIIGEIVPAGAAQYPDRVKIADLNGDGRADIVYTEEISLQPASVRWFEAPVDPTQGSWTRHTIVTQYTTNSMDVADIDDDGDIDVITQEHRGTQKLQVWRNDGCGNFTEHVVDTGVEGHLGARVADLDGDGDLEIFSIAFDDYTDLNLWRNDNGPGLGQPIEAPVARIRVNTSLPGAAPCSIIFDATSSTPASTIAQYFWEFSDGGVASGPVVSHGFSANGVFGATLTVLDVQNTSSVDSATVYVGPVAASLIGEWTFDEPSGSTAYDQSPQGNDVIFHGNADRSAGFVGNALLLDGISGYASRPDASISGAFPSVSNGTGRDFTFAAWIYLETQNARQPIIAKQGEGLRGVIFNVEEDNHLTCEIYRNQSDATLLVSNQTLAAHTWYHVAVTYDYTANGSSIGRLYVNGLVDMESSSVVGPPAANSVELSVGRYRWSGAYIRYFDGRIDDLYAYGRALTGPEITALATPPPDGDADHNGTVDLADAKALVTCLAGPGGAAWENCRQVFDLDADADVDLRDTAWLQRAFNP